MAKLIDNTAEDAAKVEEGDEAIFPGVLYLKPNGTVVRIHGALVAPTGGAWVDGVASEHVVVDPAKGLWGRVCVGENAARGGARVPVVVYFHGGAAVCGAPDMVTFVGQADALARESGVVVVAVSYRLAPDWKLPAAYHDAFTSLLWLQNQAKLQGEGQGDEPLLTKHADFSKCFVMGESSGANIVHHLTLQHAKEDLAPVVIRGLIAVVPWFGQQERTESETRFGASDPLVKLAACDRLWELALPVGATRDHPYCNVCGPEGLQALQAMQFQKMLMVVNLQDLMCSKQMEYHDALKRAGKDVRLLTVPKGGHTFRLTGQYPADVLRCTEAFRAFIHEP